MLQVQDAGATSQSAAERPATGVQDGQQSGPSEPMQAQSGGGDDSAREPFAARNTSAAVGSEDWDDGGWPPPEVPFPPHAQHGCESICFTTLVRRSETVSNLFNMQPTLQSTNVCTCFQTGTAEPNTTFRIETFGLQESMPVADAR